MAERAETVQEARLVGRKMCHRSQTRWGSCHMHLTCDSYVRIRGSGVIVLPCLGQMIVTGSQHSDHCGRVRETIRPASRWLSAQQQQLSAQRKLAYPRTTMEGVETPTHATGTESMKTKLRFPNFLHRWAESHRTVGRIVSRALPQLPRRSAISGARWTGAC